MTTQSCRWVRVAGELLEVAGNYASRRTCNDWLWPEEWSMEQRVELATAMVAENVHRPVDGLKDADREEIARMVQDKYGPPDWWVMSFLGRRLAAT